MERKNPLEGNPVESSTGVCVGAALGCGDKREIPAVVEGPLESNSFGVKTFGVKPSDPLESNPLPKLPQDSAQG